MPKKKKKRTKYTFKGGRAYIHSRCGQETLITENSFKMICDPFEPCLSTLCCHCQKHHNLSEFKWADTGERIANFRYRVKQKAPAWLAIWNQILTPLIGILGGLAAAYYTGQMKSIVGAAIIVVLFFLIAKFIIGPGLGQMFHKTPFYTMR